MARWLCLFCVSLLGLTALAVAPPTVVSKPGFDPESAYRIERMRGWELKINRVLDDEKHTPLRKQVLELLDDHLYRITRVVPADALKKLTRVPLWIELSHPKHPCMCYHVSPGWLRDNQMNPRKAGCVELSNCANFLTWTHNQPWMVFHELAHAYHHQVLGYEHAEVRACYEEAMKQKLYDRVLHIDGSTRKHYACTNPMEYFAEASEAYFGTNDFYPFVRAELRKHDPRAVAMLEKLWGIKKR